MSILARYINAWGEQGNCIKENHLVVQQEQYNIDTLKIVKFFIKSGFLLSKETRLLIVHLHRGAAKLESRGAL